MPCYHPLTAYYDGYIGRDGSKQVMHYKFEGEDVEFVRENKKKLRFVKLDDRNYRDDILYLPCGKCIGCRMDYSRKWADRMMLELDSWNGTAIFLTLTYDNRHLVDKDGNLLNKCRCPDETCNDKCYWSPCCMRKDGSLYKRHVQLFMKSLRKELAKPENGSMKCRFYCCGEYGSWSHTHRPHYHLILYGLDLASIPDKRQVEVNELKQVSYTSPFIADHWPHGNISFSDVSWNTCAYVARYVTKKAIDTTNDITLEKCNVNPLFSTMSRKPGIGGYYLENHPDCLDMTKIPISTSNGAKEIYIPRYFVDRLKLTDEEKYDSLIAKRMACANDSVMQKLSKTDLQFLDYLEVEEKIMLSHLKQLKRHKVRNSLY